MLKRDGVFLQWNLMLDDVFVISLKVTVLPGKDISKLLHHGAISRALGSRQVGGQIYVLWVIWALYIMSMDCRLILFLGRLMRYIIMIKQLL